MNKAKTSIWITAATLLTSLFLAPACGPQKTAQAPDPVTVQLKWVHQAQFAGFYMAQENGTYAEENIEITLVEGGPDVDVVGQVASGDAHFGVYAPEELIVRRSQGQPLVAIAVIYRRNPLVFVSKANSGIERPADFLGKTAAIAPDGMVQFRAMMERLELDPQRVEMAPYRYDFGSFYSGEVDITEAYLTGGLVRIRRDGYRVNVIWPGDYGIHMYADTLFTTERMMENPDLVTRFLRATLRGWRRAIENPDAAVAATLKYAHDADPEMQGQMMQASIPLIHTGEDHIGWMRAEVWEGMHDILLEQGVLDEPLDVADIANVDRAFARASDEMYTMEFLYRVYEDDASAP